MSIYSAIPYETLDADWNQQHGGKIGAILQCMHTYID